MRAVSPYPAGGGSTPRRGGGVGYVPQIPSEHEAGTPPRLAARADPPPAGEGEEVLVATFCINFSGICANCVGGDPKAPVRWWAARRHRSGPAAAMVGTACRRQSASMWDPPPHRRVTLLDHPAALPPAPAVRAGRDRGRRRTRRARARAFRLKDGCRK